MYVIQINYELLNDIAMHNKLTNQNIPHNNIGIVLQSHFSLVLALVLHIKIILVSNYLF